MNLIERIDLALRHARKTRAELATGIGVTAQALRNLERRPGSRMKIEHVARTARYLQCDIYWLCTGEGAYTPEAQSAKYSFLATEAARFLDAMQEPDRERAFAYLYQMAKGRWPKEGKRT